MLVEAHLSRRNEAYLRALGAVEPPGDVYRLMQVAYPGAFVLMAVEGAVRGEVRGAVVRGAAVFAGLVVLIAAKALKYWAIHSLGPRWTFRVLVPPAAVTVRTGPYLWLNHPNYVGVIGELVGMALLVGAWITGPAATCAFGLLIARRIRVENAALGRHRPASPRRTIYLRQSHD
jgi:methyltransferase